MQRLHASLLSACLLCSLFHVIGVAETTARTPWTTSRVRGLPTPPPPYQIVPAFPQLKFANPTSVSEFPTGDRLLVTQSDGKMFSFPKQADVQGADLVADLSSLAGGGVALFHATFHPRFIDNRYVFVCLVHPDGGGHTRVSRFRLTAGDVARIDPASEQVIIRWPSGGHNGGCLQFGKDGYLYISTGDGSGPNPPDGRTTGQDVSDLLGAVLRLDVDHSAGGVNYSIPSDNPFVAVAGARPEIWSYGLRNPWKFGIDPATGDVFVCDNGWETWELVHKLSRGSNGGWPIMEGRAKLRTEVQPGPTPITPPVMDHPHTEANSVIGGPVYRGQKLAELDGTFVYGDYITGTIWGLKATEGGGYEPSTLVDTDLRIVAFTAGSRGELYVLDYDYTGQIYELIPSGMQDDSAHFPRRISETGIFSSVQALEPADGVVPYTVIAERWTDGAQAQRWVGIPGSASIKLSAEPTDSEFPEGTVFIKQLNLPNENGTRGRLETQLLHYEHGLWNPYSYLWNEDGTDAWLASSGGMEREVAWKDQAGSSTPRTWHVSAVNECRLCHNAKAGVVLGFTAKQLDRASDSPATPQLDLLVEQGVLADRPTIPSTAVALVDPHDASREIAERARSYLHANCAMCHHRGGTAIISFYLHRDYPFHELRTNKGTGIGTFGMLNPKIITPGDPYRSILAYRITKLGYGRMPYVGSRVVDSDGVGLVEQWIKSLPAQDEQLSAVVVPGTDVAQALAAVTQDAHRDSHAAVAKLLETTEGALALAGAMHRGQVSALVRQDVAAASGELKSDLRGLFDDFIPESRRKLTLGMHPDPESILKLAGDAARGALIFLSDNARCRACHDAANAGKSLGPTLPEIRKKYNQSSELLKHILEPSLKVDEPFVAWSLVTGDGQPTSGVLIEQNDAYVRIRTAELKTLTIPRASIEDIRKNEKSLMPDGVLSDLSPQEAADLLAFLTSKTAGQTSGK